ncbi:MAG TPA: rod shape-determining protein MreD [Clostridiales bacterium]|nr:rod shape-determining protein MreD [Clostridiales bacterium]
MNKKLILLLILFLLSVIIRVSIGEYLYLMGNVPNILLITVVVVSMIVPGGWVPYVYAVLCGMIEDMLYSRQIGYHILFFCATALAVSLARNKLMKNNILFCLLFVMAATFLYESMNWLFFGYFRMGVGVAALFKETLTPVMAINLLLTPVFYFLYNLLLRSLSDEKGAV